MSRDHSPTQRPVEAPEPVSRTSSIWGPFVWWAMGLAMVSGFGLGGLLFAAPALGWSLGRVWPASAQVHAHTFLFGWAGLMVLGVGVYFLPRLRGRPLAEPQTTGVVLALLVSGLLLRTLSQPMLARIGTEGLAVLPRLGLVLSGLLELLGASVGLVLLGRMLRGSPPLTSRPRLLEILPFLVVAFGSLWLALALNLVAVASAPTDGVLTGPGHELSLMIGLYGFLVPISVGIGARLFPLHFAAPLPDLPVLRAGLGILLGGMAVRITGELAGLPLVAAIGLSGMAVALGLFVVGSRVFASRRRVPGGRLPWYKDAAQWHGLLAFVWLAVDAVLLAGAAFANLVPGTGSVPLQAEWHIVGVGFVTLLIYGEAANLLPGFAGRPLRSTNLVWMTLALGMLAVVLRVGPALAPGFFNGPLGRGALVASGVAGLLATLALAVNLHGAATSDRPRELTGTPLSGKSEMSGS